MDEKWMQQVAEWAAEKGIPEETLFEELRKLEAKGEIGLTYLKNQMTSKVETQEDARTLFRMAAQEGYFSDTDDYIEVFPNLGEITKRKAIKDFMSVRIKNDRLQKRNIMLTPELWHTLVENKKELVTDRILKKTLKENPEIQPDGVLVNTVQAFEVIRKHYPQILCGFVDMKQKADFPADQWTFYSDFNQREIGMEAVRQLLRPDYPGKEIAYTAKIIDGSEC